MARFAVANSRTISAQMAAGLTLAEAMGIAQQERAGVVELREQGATPENIATRLGLTLQLVRDHLTVADWQASAAA